MIKMKNKPNIFCINILLIVALSSCAVTYGDKITRSTTLITNNQYSEKANNVELYFENENIDFEYEKIGFVEVKGNQNSSTSLLLDYLQFEAWDNYANAVINVQSLYVDREITTLMSDNDSKVQYSAQVFNGLAIRIKTKSNSDPLSSNLSFKKTVKENSNEESKQTVSQVVASIVGTFALSVTYYYYYLLGKE